MTPEARLQAVMAYMEKMSASWKKQLEAASGKEKEHIEDKISTMRNVYIIAKKGENA